MKVGDYLIRNNYFSVLLICQHSLLRSSFTMFICDYCGKSFLLKHVLNTHMKIYDDNECMCDVCEKICKNKVALKDHKKIHSNPVECNLSEEIPQTSKLEQTPQIPRWFHVCKTKGKA